MNNHKKPKLGTYVLQCLQGQFWTDHFLILDLNKSSDWADFISLGRWSQSFGPKILRDSAP